MGGVNSSAGVLGGCQAVVLARRAEGETPSGRRRYFVSVRWNRLICGAPRGRDHYSRQATFDGELLKRG